MEKQTTKLDKAVKISIIAGVLSIVFYFLIFLPYKEMSKVKARKDCAVWALDNARAKRIEGDGYTKTFYDGYFARCLREKGITN